jgi:hypothetical protein
MAGEKTSKNKGGAMPEQPQKSAAFTCSVGQQQSWPSFSNRFGGVYFGINSARYSDTTRVYMLMNSE